MAGLDRPAAVRPAAAHLAAVRPGVSEKKRRKTGMKNEMRVEFDAKSVNEGFARGNCP